jgi:hypothetical protein
MLLNYYLSKCISSFLLPIVRTPFLLFINRYLFNICYLALLSFPFFSTWNHTSWTIVAVVIHLHLYLLVNSIILQIPCHLSNYHHLSYIITILLLLLLHLKHGSQQHGNIINLIYLLLHHHRWANQIIQKKLLVDHPIVQ